MHHNTSIGIAYTLILLQGLIIMIAADRST